MIRQHYPAPHQMRDDIGGWGSEPAGLAAAGGLAEFGITRSLVETYSVGPYRYTNLDDAIAQAKRDRTARQTMEASP